MRKELGGYSSVTSKNSFVCLVKTQKKRNLDKNMCIHEPRCGANNLNKCTLLVLSMLLAQHLNDLPVMMSVCCTESKESG